MLARELGTKESSGLLSAVDRMREILHDEKITLPEIVVVGDQSVGKSSVLEAISGIQLPRAQNICTRCPLELRLKSTTNKEYAVIRCGTDSEDQAKTLEDLNTISDEVTRLTEEIAGTETNVSSIPIYLTVYKRNIPYDLTLIDLPGITRNPLPGQSKDIHQQILNLINKYIEPSTAVVLHVIPASIDFTTSESMKLAKEFDPQCLRQLIAASKIDKFDKGIAEKLLGRGPGAMQLALGCVAVLNRNQDEIEANVSFEDMKEREAQFFLKHHEAFGHLPSEFKGVDQLVKKLSIIQQERIRSTLPKIIEELRKQIREKKRDLKTIPIALTSEQDCWRKFQTMIDAFRESIRAKVNGDYDILTRINMIDPESRTNSTLYRNAVLPSRNLSNSSLDSTPDDDRIAYHVYKFQRRFQDELLNTFPDFYSHKYYELVLHAIDDAAGVSLPNFPSFQIIERLFRAELQRLPNVCWTLIERIRDYLKESLLRIFHQSFDCQYARLLEKMKNVVIKKIDAAECQVEERVNEILEMELRVFTMNNQYMERVTATKENINQRDKAEEGKAAPPPVSLNVMTSTAAKEFMKLPTKTLVRNESFSSNQESKNSSISLLASPLMGPISYALSSNEAIAAHDIQIALCSYTQVVQKRIIDSISQTCYHQFITKCALIIDRELTLSCPSSDLLHYMKEPVDQTTRRDNLTRTIKAYEDALTLGQDCL